MGDSINFTMAAAGFNFRKLMVKLQQTKRWLFMEIVLLLNSNLFFENTGKQERNIKMKMAF